MANTIPHNIFHGVKMLPAQSPKVIFQGKQLPRSEYEKQLEAAIRRRHAKEILTRPGVNSYFLGTKNDDDGKYVVIICVWGEETNYSRSDLAQLRKPIGEFEVVVKFNFDPY